LPKRLQVAAAKRAVSINPANHPGAVVVTRALGAAPTAARIAVLIGKRWPAAGVRLTVAFLDNPPTDLRTRILLHMNAWGKSANVQFTLTKTNPQVRIARASSPASVSGYWS